MIDHIEIVDAYDDALIVRHYKGVGGKFYLHVRPSVDSTDVTAVALTRAQVKELRRELKRMLQEAKV